MGSVSKPVMPKRLIISSGDISDVDGLYAIAKYAFTGCDVLFVMNYPAYINEDSDVGPLLPGLGYKYKTVSYLETFEAGHTSQTSTPGYVKYNALLNDIYGDIADLSVRVKQILTDMAYSMVARTWTDVNFPNKGKLYFCIGGVNSFNPFSMANLKNEIYVYSTLMAVYKSKSGGVTNVETRMLRLSPCNEGVIFERSHYAMAIIPEGCTQVESSIRDLVLQYEVVYIDFNGSMAFFNGEWERTLRDCRDTIKGVCVMGGVYSFEPPGTMPSIAGVLNRFSCATMNQLYHPLNTAKFFRLLGELNILVYIIANNAVGTQETIDNTNTKTDDGWMKFFNINFSNNYFHSQLLGGTSVLQKFAHVYYNCEYAPPRRAFDFYTAVALDSLIGNVKIGSDANLFFDGMYGIVLVSNRPDYTNALHEYSSRINVAPAADDLPFIRSKKLNFITELHILKADTACEMLRVRNVRFEDIPGKKLRVELSGVPYELVLRTYYLPAQSNFGVSLVVQRISGEDLLNSANDLQLKIRFAQTLKPSALIFNNGNTWGNPEFSGSESVSFDWEKFRTYHEARPDQTRVTIESFFSDTIELVLRVFGPEAGPSDLEPTDSAVINISFSPPRP